MKKIYTSLSILLGSLTILTATLSLAQEKVAEVKGTNLNAFKYHCIHSDKSKATLVTNVYALDGETAIIESVKKFANRKETSGDITDFTEIKCYTGHVQMGGAFL